jgi:hypothetical protein
MEQNAEVHKRKNVRVIGEIQRKNSTLVIVKLERRFAIFIFSQERRFLIYTFSALLLLEALLISKRLRVYS